MEKYWFKRKVFGWGWYPATWQGWSIIGLYILLLVLSGYNANFLKDTSSDPLFSFFPETFFYTIILLLITFKTGETPKWQWGKNKNHDN